MASTIREFLILDFLEVCYCIRIGQCKCQTTYTRKSSSIR